MKQRLFLLVASILLAGIGTARADCVRYVEFPNPGDQDKVVQAGTCITSDPSISTSPKLRWDNNSDGKLILWDSDEGTTPIPMAWCAHDSSGNCAVGSQLCAQADGNLVIYKDLTGTCQGTPVWASGTNGKNLGGERLTTDYLGTLKGDRAIILNGVNTSSAQIIWESNNFDSD